MILSTIFILFYIAHSSKTNQTDEIDSDDCSSTIIHYQIDKVHSPINLKQTQALCDNLMTFDFQFIDEFTTIEMKKQSHTISTDAPVSTLRATDMSGQIINLVATSFEFRSPSEHKIDGVSYDMEMQIYHQIEEESNSTTKIAVVSIFFKIDKKLSQPFFDEYYFRIVRNQDSATLTINFEETLGVQIPSDPGFYTYMGSVTSPMMDVSCNDGVQWYILDTILPISKAQLQQFNSFFNETRQQQKILEYQTVLVKQRGPYCENHIPHDLAMFLVYCAVIYAIYRSI